MARPCFRSGLARRGAAAQLLPFAALLLASCAPHARAADCQLASDLTPDPVGGGCIHQYIPEFPGFKCEGASRGDGTGETCSAAAESTIPSPNSCPDPGVFSALWAACRNDPNHTEYFNGLTANFNRPRRAAGFLSYDESVSPSNTLDVVCVNPKFYWEPGHVPQNWDPDYRPASWHFRYAGKWPFTEGMCHRWKYTPSTTVADDCEASTAYADQVCHADKCQECDTSYNPDKSTDSARWNQFYGEPDLSAAFFDTALFPDDAAPLCKPVPDGTQCNATHLCSGGTCSVPIGGGGGGGNNETAPVCNQTADDNGCLLQDDGQGTGTCIRNASAFGLPCTGLSGGGACQVQVCRAGGCTYEDSLLPACDDGDACTINDSCRNSSGGGPVACEGDFDNTGPRALCCRTVADCAPVADAQCESVSCPAATCVSQDLVGSCDDGDACNGADTCASGSCSDHAFPAGDCGPDPCSVCNGTACDAVALASAVPCTQFSPGEILPCQQQLCNGATGCDKVPLPGVPCNATAVTVCGGQPETVSGTCNGALACLPDVVVTLNCSCTSDSNCTDFNPCTDDTCDLATGQCNFSAVPGRPCDNNIFCDGADTCGADGSCSQHAGDPCAGGGYCNSTCNEALEHCFAPADSGTVDNSASNWCLGTKCDGAGSFTTFPTPTCAGVSGTCGVCDPVAQSCYSPAGSPCDDQDPCTGLGTDACDGSGNCRAGNIVNTSLPSSDPCLSATQAERDACRGGVPGSCTQVNATAFTCQSPDLTPCSDGLWCNGESDSCQAGLCTPAPGQAVDCNADAPATGCLRSCNETSRSCDSSEMRPCDDGNACTSASFCSDSTGQCGGTCTDLLNCSYATFDEGQVCTPPGGPNFCFRFTCQASQGGACAVDPQNVDPCLPSSGTFDLVKQCFRSCNALTQRCEVRVGSFCNDRDRSTCGDKCVDDPANPCQGNSSKCVRSSRTTSTTTGFVGLPPPPPFVAPPVESNSPDSASGTSAWLLYVVIGALGLVCCIVLVVAGVIFRKQQRQQEQNAMDMRDVAMMSQAGRMTRETLREMFQETLLTGDIEVQDRLGSGSFGDVYRGLWQDTTVVAMKTLKEAQGHALHEFATEALTLKEMRHPNCLQFLGVWIPGEDAELDLPVGTAVREDGHESSDSSSSSGSDSGRSNGGGGQVPDLFMVTEYMALGSLDSWCRAMARAGGTDPSDLLDIARQAAAGMAYLASRNVIHRDLALRNLLATRKGGAATAGARTPRSPDMTRTNRSLDSGIIVKVADFGLSRILTDEESYYKTDCSTMPIKWTAPEGIEFGKFSSKSDVWSFGVVLWELFSGGAMPYPGMSNGDTVDSVLDGFRMPKPTDMPQDLYDEVVLPCWEEDPKKRLTFAEVQTALGRVIKKFGGVVGPSEKLSKAPAVSGGGVSESFYATASGDETPEVADGEGFYHTSENDPPSLPPPVAEGESFYHNAGPPSPPLPVEEGESFYHNPSPPEESHPEAPNESFYETPVTLPPPLT